MAKKGLFEKVKFSCWKSDDFVLLQGEAKFLNGGAVGAVTEKPYLGSKICVRMFCSLLEYSVFLGILTPTLAKLMVSARWAKAAIWKKIAGIQKMYVFLVLK